MSENSSIQDEKSLTPDPMVSDLTPRELAELDSKSAQMEASVTELAEQSRDLTLKVHGPEPATAGENGSAQAREGKLELAPVTEKIRVDSEYEGQENDSSFDDDSDESAPGSMTVVEHLTELRDRLVRSLVYIVIGFGITLYFGKDIMRVLQAPAGVNMEFQALSIEEPLLVYIKVAFYGALVLASPFILFEVSRFIGPGLTEREKRIVSPALIGGPLLFVCGAAFAYFLLLPSMLHFFSSFGTGVAPVHQRLDFYMSLVSTVLLYMGLAFQLPIVIFALSFTGLVTSDHLIRFWRYAVFGASVVALVITPDPTAFSMLLVMGALVTLYAVSVLVLKAFGR